jgi:hypothetical protein
LDSAGALPLQLSVYWFHPVPCIPSVTVTIRDILEAMGAWSNPMILCLHPSNATMSFFVKRWSPLLKKA